MIDSTPELERLITEHPFFQDMDGELRKTMVECARLHIYAAGEYIHRHGDPAERHAAMTAPTAHHVSNSNNSNTFEIKPAKIVAKGY